MIHKHEWHWLCSTMMTWYVEGMRELFLMDGSSIQWHYYYVTVGVLAQRNLLIDYTWRTTVLALRVIPGIRSASSSLHCKTRYSTWYYSTIGDAEYVDLVVYLEPGTEDDSKCCFSCHQLTSIWHAAALVTATSGRSDYTVLEYFRSSSSDTDFMTTTEMAIFIYDEYSTCSDHFISV